MAGIVCGGVIGGPAITVLMRRYGITGSQSPGAAPTPVADDVEGRVAHTETDAAREFNALKAIVVLLLAVWAGGWVMQGIRRDRHDPCRRPSAACWSARWSATSTTPPTGCGCPCTRWT
jgi:Na+/glutamate symporter